MKRKRFYVDRGVEAWLIYDREDLHGMRFTNEDGHELGRLGSEAGMAIVVNLGGRARARFLCAALNAGEKQ